jgi:hypothetical protein
MIAGSQWVSLILVFAALSAPIGCSQSVSSTATKGAPSSKTVEEQKLSQDAERAVTLRRKKIQEDMATLEDHPWAGDYYEGDGTGVNVSLTLAPNSGFVFEWHGCGGLYDDDVPSPVESCDGGLGMRSR